MPLIPAVVLLSAATLASPALARPQEQTERVDRTVPIPANGQLRLKNFSGRVTITGTSRADVSVHAVRRADRDRLDHIHLDITQSGSGVTIDANKKDDSWSDRDNNVVETEFDIEVPADVSLDVSVFSSSVDVKDVRGSQRIHTFSGNVDLAGVWSSVDANTFSGDISVGLANATGGSVTFTTFSGSIHSDAAMQLHSSNRREFTASIGAGSNEYRFKTFSGNITIK
jgi:DUF4097 and DUF4098 domain-containing protein YvlB